MTFAGNIEHGLPFKAAGTANAKLRIEPGQSTDQRGVVRFRAPRREVARGLGRKSGPLRYCADDMSLDFNRGRRGRSGRQLWVKGGGDSISTLRRESRGGIE